MIDSFRLPIVFLVSAFAFGEGIVQNSAFADKPIVKNIDRDSLTDLVITVKDDNGNPISDAAVTAYGVGVQEGTGKGFWNNKTLGPPTAVRSNSQGQVTLKYPAKVPFQKATLTTNSVLFVVSHYDYVQKSVEYKLGDRLPEVFLKRGCDIQLSAVDQEQQPVEDFAVMVAGPYAPEFWINTEKGGRRTGAASDGNWQTMIVKPQPDGATLFSSVLRLRVRPQQAVRIQNVRVKPGTRVVGKLSDNVPRPVKNGYIVSTTVPKPASDSSSKVNPSLCWHQSAPINADGTFELKSIPSTGKLQLLAFCNDWLAKTIPDEKFFVRGQMFDVSKDEMNITIEMEETGSLEVSVTTPDGQPLDSGTLSSWPTQYFYKTGEALLGDRRNTMKLITNQLQPIEKKVIIETNEQVESRFTNQRVKDGVATLKGLPIHRNNMMELEHDDYVLEGNNVVRFSIDSADPKKIAVKTK